MAKISLTVSSYSFIRQQMKLKKLFWSERVTLTYYFFLDTPTVLPRLPVVLVC